MKRWMNYILLTSLLAAFVLVPNRVGTSYAQERPVAGDVAEELPGELREAREKMAELASSGQLQEAADINQSLLQEWPDYQSFSTAYEEIDSCGFYPQEARLACVVRIKRPSGYGNHPIGTMEHIKFCIDWYSDGAWQLYDSVGESHVNVHNDSDFPRDGWNYLVYRDINPWNPARGGPRVLDNVAMGTPTFRARAILSWFSPPTSCTDRPFWGNTYDFNIQLDPAR